MKKVLTYLAATMALSLGVLFISGCGSQTSNSEAIKIGANLELTGTNATFGSSAKNGIQMAIDEINDKGGVFHRKLELVTADNRSDTAESVIAMQKLVDEKVGAIIGPMTSSGMIAAGAISSDAKILAISPSASNPAVTVDPKTGQVKPFVFRGTFIDPFQGRLMADFAIRDLMTKRAAILVDSSNEYSKGLADYFTLRFEQLGGKVIKREAYLQRDTDFRAVLTSIKGEQPDIIFIPGYYQEVGMIIKQAREMDITVPLIGGDGWDSSKLAGIAGAANLENTFFSTHYSASDTSKSVHNFVQRYEKKYGDTPDSFALLSYDAVYMIKAAMEKADIFDTEKIAAAMQSIKSFSGASGDITFDSDHNAISPGIIMGFNKQGKPVFKSHINP